MFDCACGTGGMLTGGQEHLADLNPEARLEVFGQELNPETWAIARSDMHDQGPGPDPHRPRQQPLRRPVHRPAVRLHARQPAVRGGLEEASQKQLNDEHEQLGDDGRFGAGLPARQRRQSCCSSST